MVRPKNRHPLAIEIGAPTFVPKIGEHDETGRDQEEVFLVLSGDGAKIVIDDEEHDLPPGSFARLDPELTRTVLNNGSGPVRLLIASAPRGSGYEPMGWA